LSLLRQLQSVPAYPLNSPNQYAGRKPAVVSSAICFVIASGTSLSTTNDNCQMENGKWKMEKQSRSRFEIRSNFASVLTAEIRLFPSRAEPARNDVAREPP